MRRHDNGPLVGRAAIDKNQDPAGISATPSLIRVDPLDEIAWHVDGTFVLVIKVAGGRYRRRCFLTSAAAAAERAARNPQEAGHDAEVFLAELRPLWRLAGSSPDLFSGEVGMGGAR
jgi:hypothetical protein